MSGSRKRLPPLNTIAAFEASARLMSFTGAAEELSLSQGAVSRQIQRLEERIGTSLFERRHKKIELTRAGDIFYRAICQSLVSIRHAVQDIERLNSSQVSISASLAMSSFWVMPAILKFKQLAPQINVSILANDHVLDPSREAVDLAILYGDGAWPNLKVHKLFDEVIFPVCSPQYAGEHRIETIEDLSRCTLIEVVTVDSVCGSWEEWFSQAGLPGPFSQVPTLKVSNHDLAYRAAEAGQGVTLAWNYGPQEILRSKRLVRPLEAYVATGMAEYLVSACYAEERPTVERVWDLLVAFSQEEGAPVF
ncbi:Glycine cleavage system transcriptional activator [Pseudomonas sp. MM221]|nr:Glycine cleavage system transcriptional activator [Pseudomonas sp. MM223]CAI3798407.1 Glycine cleavage system transcriptional activator [Pseudomonas sp. MM221]